MRNGRSEYLKTYVNDMDMKREGYVEGEKRGRAEGEKVMQKKLQTTGAIEITDEPNTDKTSFCRIHK